MNESSASADRLQQLLERVENGEAPEDLLAEAGTDLDAASCALLASRLSDTLPASPDPAYRARLQVVLQSEMHRMHGGATQDGQAPRGLAVLFRRLAPQAVSLVVALSLILATAVAASADSLPGQALYGVKRTFEDTRVQFAFTAELRSHAYQHQADERLWELEQLVHRGDRVDPSLITDLLASQEAALDAALDADEALVDETESHAADNAETLAGLTDSADPESKESLSQAAEALREASGVSSADPEEQVSPEPALADPAPIGHEPTASASALPPTGAPTTVATRSASPQPGVDPAATNTSLPPTIFPTQPDPAHTDQPTPQPATAVVESPIPSAEASETPRPTSEREGGRAATTTVEAGATLTAEARRATSESVAPLLQETPTATNTTTATPTRRPWRPGRSGPRALPPRPPSGHPATPLPRP